MRVTMRNRNSKTLQTISNMDPNVKSWIYRLIFHIQGRHLTKLNSKKRISRDQYIKYHYYRI